MCRAPRDTSGAKSVNLRGGEERDGRDGLPAEEIGGTVWWGRIDGRSRGSLRKKPVGSRPGISAGRGAQEWGPGSSTESRRVPTRIDRESLATCPGRGVATTADPSHADGTAPSRAPAPGCRRSARSLVRMRPAGVVSTLEGVPHARQGHGGRGGAAAHHEATCRGNRRVPRVPRGIDLLRQETGRTTTCPRSGAPGATLRREPMCAASPRDPDDLSHRQRPLTYLPAISRFPLEAPASSCLRRWPNCLPRRGTSRLPVRSSSSGRSSARRAGWGAGGVVRAGVHPGRWPTGPRGSEGDGATWRTYFSS